MVAGAKEIEKKIFPHARVDQSKRRAQLDEVDAAHESEKRTKIQGETVKYPIFS